MGSNSAVLPTTIPTVDISPFLDENASPEAKEQVVDAMRDACTTFGFFYLVGHGIPEEDRQAVLNCAKRYFYLPKEDKMETWIGKAMGRSFRGYEPPALQVHQEGLLPDTKEVSRHPRDILRVVLIVKGLHYRPRDTCRRPRSWYISHGS
ncbi:hypothetical protein AO1008_09387 [Aspergillus oryzae 100-8]|uniref:Non-haem dioxygenase N-terminal domain-containing protein n=1 Tax=Aspergillus oryzae (strain 3.042) TaxID=1160506 RepID=I7ZMD4_ASPO3|nr:hypothetical protein Ao3042_11119 [Aspergillus oryzae 3.042]KDE82839.1 hypothetical protein AO1008_09387 [Aspergillus oryzae 100-8]|eukprot:EIT73134.1 hypothetical protein Ao3042_11119 [Aspergillus oryzae 3.042]